jgi:hypothetical protein
VYAFLKLVYSFVFTEFAFESQNIIKQSSSSPQIMMRPSRRTIDNIMQQQPHQVQPQPRPNDISHSGYKTNETLTFTKAKRLSKFSSMNENASRPNKQPLRATLQLPAIVKVNKPQQEPQQTIKSRFTKYTSGSFKENKSTKNTTSSTIASRRHSVMVNQPEEDASIQFSRPLKTSTTVCLTNLNGIAEHPSSNKLDQIDNQNAVKKMKLSQRESLHIRKFDESPVKKMDVLKIDKDKNKRRHSYAMANPVNSNINEYFDSVSNKARKL